MKLSIKAIVTDAGTQTRVKLNQETVDEYAQAMLNGSDFPPLVVFKVGAKYILADGFHRYAAAGVSKLTMIECTVKDGSLTDAILHSIKSNHAHGLRRSNEDKRKCVAMALEIYPDFSSRQIAELCGVSHTFVESCRPIQVATVATCHQEPQQKGTSFSEPSSKPPSRPPMGPPPTTRTGTDGKEYPAPVPPPVSTAPQPPPRPKTTADLPKDEEGHPLNDKLQVIWRRRGEVEKIAQDVSKVRCYLKKVKEEDKDPLWSELHLSMVQSELDSVYYAIESAKPYAICPYCQGMGDGCTTCGGKGLLGKYEYDHAPKAFKAKTGK